MFSTTTSKLLKQSQTMTSNGIKKLIGRCLAMNSGRQQNSSLAAISCHCHSSSTPSRPPQPHNTMLPSIVDSSTKTNELSYSSLSSRTYASSSSPLSKRKIMKSRAKNKSLAPTTRQKTRTLKLRSLQDLGIVDNGLIRRPPEWKFKKSKPSAIRVKSIYAAQTLNIVAILSQVFRVGGAYAPIKHTFGKMSLVVQLPNHSNTTPTTTSPVAPRFIAVFRFGSVVFFNISPLEEKALLQDIKKHGTDSIAPGFERIEHYDVVQDAALQEDPHVVAHGDYAIVNELDIHGATVIANIMGQTVALDSYSDTVDELLTQFASINATVGAGESSSSSKKSNFTQIDKEALFRVVAHNNSIFIDLISKVGTKERTDTAWNLSQFSKIHEGMMEEFEINDRSQHIEYKLDLIQKNAKFFLEILHNQKSNSLEWTIIVLILFECILMLLDMSGMGTTLFENMMQSSDVATISTTTPATASNNISSNNSSI